MAVVLLAQPVRLQSKRMYLKTMAFVSFAFAQTPATTMKKAATPLAIPSAVCLAAGMKYLAWMAASSLFAAVKQ